MVTNLLITKLVAPTVCTSQRDAHKYINFLAAMAKETKNRNLLQRILYIYGRPTDACGRPTDACGISRLVELNVFPPLRFLHWRQPVSLASVSSRLIVVLQILLEPGHDREDRIGLTQSEFANMLGVSLRTYKSGNKNAVCLRVRRSLSLP